MLACGSPPFTLLSALSAQSKEKVPFPNLHQSSGCQLQPWEVTRLNSQPVGLSPSTPVVLGRPGSGKRVPCKSSPCIQLGGSLAV